MIETKVTPDFIVIDGGEGGTGAAPQELTNHVGLPLLDAPKFVQSALIGAGLRDKMKIGASGKIITAYDVCRVFALGADYVMSARGFMFAVGCIQARSCHSNRCPTGVATQGAWRQRALVVRDKAVRVANFHHNTVKAVGQVIASAGLSHPSDIKPMHLHMRDASGQVMRGDEAVTWPAPGVFLNGGGEAMLAREWARAQANSFRPAA